MARVESVMSHRVPQVPRSVGLTVGADDEVRCAAELMLDHQVERLAVTDDDDRVVGVISWQDLMDHARSA